MKAIIERQLYHPAVVLPMVSLIQIMVQVDFNLSQAGFVVATQGARAALQRSREMICRFQHCDA